MWTIPNVAWLALVGLGLGLMLAGGCLGWLFRREWERVELRLANRVAGMVKNILTTRAVENGDPGLSRELAEQVLFDYAKLRELVNELSARVEHVANGGHPDDSPAKWKRKD